MKFSKNISNTSTSRVLSPEEAAKYEEAFRQNSQDMEKSFRYFHLYFIIPGLIILIIGLMVLNNVFSFIRKSETVKGKVIENVLTTDSDEDNYYYPKVTFNTKTGEEITFTGDIDSYPPDYTVGRTVEVLYNKEDQYDAKIKSFISLWLLPLVLIGFGGIFVLAGFGAKSARKETNSIS